MSMVTDFHTHILPEIDDGSGSAAESIAMLRMEKEQGVSRVVATPHFYAHHDTPEHFLTRRRDAEAKLRTEMTWHPGLPQLDIGAEVFYFRGISDCEALRELAISGTRCILIEMPAAPWTDRMYREMGEIPEKQGLTPIVAHVDRYIAPFRTHGIPERLQDLPVLVQANTSFFLRRSTRGMALRMLQKDQIHLLGSDCHNLSERAPNLGAAAELIGQRLGKEIIERIRLHESEVLL